MRLLFLWYTEPKTGNRKINSGKLLAGNSREYNVLAVRRLNIWKQEIIPGWSGNPREEYSEPIISGMMPVFPLGTTLNSASKQVSCR